MSPASSRTALGVGSLLLGAALALSLSGCSRGSGAESGKKGNGPGGRPAAAVPVSTALAVRQDVPVTIPAIGSVEAQSTVSVRSQVTGELMRVAFAEGQDVRAGELLFTIDPRPFEAALEAARADSARQAAMAASADAQERRYADLVEKDYVTRQQYEDIRASAEAQRATLRVAEAGLRNARLNLDYCAIRAPLAGRTGSLLVHAGNVVKANDAPLVVIQQIAPINVAFAVPEQHLAEIRRHAADGPLAVRVIAPGDTGAAHTGRLTFVDNAMDGSTGTIRLKATFPNTDQALWPGQFVEVSLTLATRRGAVVIPARALQRGQQGDFVYLVAPDLTVRAQPITTGPRLDDLVVVEQGVEAGERVVTDGQLRLAPGAKVDVKNGPGHAGAPAP